MTDADDLINVDAVGQAQLVRAGDVSPLELVDATVERIERVNPELNAVIMTRYDEARAEAQGELPDGPLRGVPFLLKDIGATQAGTPNHLGNRALKAAGHMSDGDTTLGARFRAAGLITLGKTNLPELGTVPVTQSLAYGPARNPWDPERSPAGSSGGSAAAVASGMLPVAHANDGGGSTRLPAAWNGLVGLKTTRGRQPMPTSGSRLTSELVVSRTVRDTAAVLDVTHGHTSGDLYHLPPPVRPYGEEVGAEVPAGLRVAMLVEGGDEYEIDPECVTAAEVGAQLLESWGHTVETVTGEVLFGGDGRVNGQLWMAGIRHRVNLLGESLGRPLTEDEVDPYNWSSAERGSSLSAADLFRAQDIQQMWSADVCQWMDQFDVLVTPTAGCPPMRIDDVEPDPDLPWRIGRTYGRIGRFTLPFNVTGHPAISVPLHWTAEGLPAGTQFVAGIGREDLLLNIAARCETERPWIDRRPTIWAG
ncbi:MAG: amidase [Actinomycetota bacterium]|nr:amidase [Actinomycetota bacterium]